MHVHIVHALIEHLKVAPVALQVGFQMSGYCDPILRDYPEGRHPDKSGHFCGTVACIAGHARIHQLINQEGLTHAAAVKRAQHEGPACHEAATDYLGLTEQEGDRLFLQWDSRHQSMSETTIEQAVLVLEYCGLEQEVPEGVWDIVLHPEKTDAS